MPKTERSQHTGTEVTSLHPSARGNQSLKQGKDWMSLKAELSIALLGVNEDVHTPPGYIVPANLSLNFISRWRSR